MDSADIYNYTSQFIDVDKQHIYGSLIPGAVNMIVNEDNTKLKDEIAIY